MKNTLTLLLPLLLPLFVLGQGYEKRTFESSDGLSLPYRILFPENYKAGDKFPLLVFLHGYGERGTDNEAQLVHGSHLFTDKKNREQFPVIVVFPQCPAGEGSWSWYEPVAGNVAWQVPFHEKGQAPLQAVIELVEKLVAEEKVDTDRLYAMGLSMGGFGTFELIARMPGRFAAAAPICGGGNTAVTGLYAEQTALWVFHGDADSVVPVENSRKMVEALKIWGADMRYTEYPGVNHDSWTPAFAEPELLSWMFGERVRE